MFDTIKHIHSRRKEIQSRVSGNDLKAGAIKTKRQEKRAEKGKIKKGATKIAQANHDAAQSMKSASKEIKSLDQDIQVKIQKALQFTFDARALKSDHTPESIEQMREHVDVLQNHISSIAPDGRGSAGQIRLKKAMEKKLKILKKASHTYDLNKNASQKFLQTRQNHSSPSAQLPATPPMTPEPSFRQKPIPVFREGHNIFMNLPVVGGGEAKTKLLGSYAMLAEEVLTSRQLRVTPPSTPPQPVPPAPDADSAPSDSPDVNNAKPPTYAQYAQFQASKKYEKILRDNPKLSSEYASLFKNGAGDVALEALDKDALKNALNEAIEEKDTRKTIFLDAVFGCKLHYDADGDIKTKIKTAEKDFKESVDTGKDDLIKGYADRLMVALSQGMHKRDNISADDKITNLFDAYQTRANKADEYLKAKEEKSPEVNVALESYNEAKNGYDDKLVTYLKEKVGLGEKIDGEENKNEFKKLFKDLSPDYAAERNTLKGLLDEGTAKKFLKDIELPKDTPLTLDTDFNNRTMEKKISVLNNIYAPDNNGLQRKKGKTSADKCHAIHSLIHVLQQDHKDPTFLKKFDIAMRTSTNHSPHALIKGFFQKGNKLNIPSYYMHQSAFSKKKSLTPSGEKLLDALRGLKDESFQSIIGELKRHSSNTKEKDLPIDDLKKMLSFYKKPFGGKATLEDATEHLKGNAYNAAKTCRQDKSTFTESCKAMNSLICALAENASAPKEGDENIVVAFFKKRDVFHIPKYYVDTTVPGLNPKLNKEGRAILGLLEKFQAKRDGNISGDSTSEDLKDLIIFLQKPIQNAKTQTIRDKRQDKERDKIKEDVKTLKQRVEMMKGSAKQVIDLWYQLSGNKELGDLDKKA